jgi:hypothetical protein
MLPAWLFLVCLPCNAIATDPIAPPFGLSWVETPARLTHLIEEAHAKLSEKRSVNGRDAWTVEGLDQPGLSAVVFYFLGESLDEVELQYRDPAWSLNQFGELMGQVKKDLEVKYGHARLLAHSRGPEQDVTQTLVAYRWEQPQHALDLVFFAAERDKQVFRALSMHYKLAHR